jgi:acyl dehydratase
MMFWEDFEVGGRFEMGRHTFSEEEILEFGRRFDPQAFHTDPEAAKRGFFGGVIASGFHTCAIAMRIMVDSYLARAASLGAPGLENVRWPKPVRPGDTLVFVRHRWEAVNQHRDLALSMEGWEMFGRRPA